MAYNGLAKKHAPIRGCSIKVQQPLESVRGVRVKRQPKYKCARENCSKPLPKLEQNESRFCSTRCWLIFLRAELFLCRCGCGKKVGTNSSKERLYLCYASYECFIKDKPGFYYRACSASIPPAGLIEAFEQSCWEGVRAWCLINGRDYRSASETLRKRGYSAAKFAR